MQGQSLQESSASGPNHLFPTEATCRMPGRAAGINRTDDAPVTHTDPRTSHWSWHHQELSRSPLPINSQQQDGGQGLYVYKGGCSKAGSIIWCKHLCTMKSGWPAAKRPQKRQVLDGCAWNISRRLKHLEGEQDLRPSIWGSSAAAMAEIFRDG